MLAVSITAVIPIAGNTNLYTVPANKNLIISHASTNRLVTDFTKAGSVCGRLTGTSRDETVKVKGLVYLTGEVVNINNGDLVNTAIISFSGELVPNT